MRITNNMLINNMMGYVSNNLTRMQRYQSQLATGKKISVPSDDPVVAARSLRLRTDVAELEQFKKNVDDATSWVELTESTLSEMTNIYQRLSELAVDGANGSKTPEDMQKIKTEVSQLREHVISLANSTYAGRYIFSGFKTDSKLMNDDGTFAMSVSNSESIYYEIGIGDSLNVNVPGGDIFNGGESAVGTIPATAGKVTGNADITFPVTIGPSNNTVTVNVDGEEVTAVIATGLYSNTEDLAEGVETAINSVITIADPVTVSVKGKRLEIKSGSGGESSRVYFYSDSPAASTLGMYSNTRVDGVNEIPAEKGKLISDLDEFIEALDLGDHDAVSEIIGKLDDDLNNILRVRADVGARSNRLDLTANRLDTDYINFTKLMSENEDVDVAETIMNLTNEENVYNASLAAGARIIMPSLVDFLK